MLVVSGKTENEDLLFPLELSWVQSASIQAPYSILKLVDILHGSPVRQMEFLVCLTRAMEKEALKVE